MNRRERLKAILPSPAYGWLEKAYMRATVMRRRLAGVYLRRLRVGRHSLVARDAHILGWQSVRIGDHVVVGSRSVLNVNFVERGTDRIVIGDYTFVGQQNFFSSGELIALGHYTMTGYGCKFLGAGHNIDDPAIPYIASGIRDGGIIRSGCNVWFGVGATILGSVRIGHGSIIGANAMVMADIPPFSVAVGNPAHVIKRYDFLSCRWIAADAFTADMEAAIPDEAQYLAMIVQRTPHIHMPYAAIGPQQGDLA